MINALEMEGERLSFKQGRFISLHETSTRTSPAIATRTSGTELWRPTPTSWPTVMIHDSHSEAIWSNFATLKSLWLISYGGCNHVLLSVILEVLLIHCQFFYKLQSYHPEEGCNKCIRCKNRITSNNGSRWAVNRLCIHPRCKYCYEPFRYSSQRWKSRNI